MLASDLERGATKRARTFLGDLAKRNLRAQEGRASPRSKLLNPVVPPVPKGPNLLSDGASRAGVLSLMDEAYAHGKVVLGKRPSELGASVGIWESDWCAWLGAVKFANFNVKWVIFAILFLCVPCSAPAPASNNPCDG